MNLVPMLLVSVLLPTAAGSLHAAPLTHPNADAEDVEVDRVDRIRPPLGGVDFVISKFNEEIVAEFERSWNAVQHGSANIEKVVLILRTSTGVQARAQKLTNEYKKCTFPWHPATLAVVHTHPNSSPAIPQPDDLAIADKYRVPMFTITRIGMFVYDPDTKKTTKVMDGIDWLDYRKWNKKRSLKH